MCESGLHFVREPFLLEFLGNYSKVNDALCLLCLYLGLGLFTLGHVIKFDWLDRYLITEC